MRVPALSRSSLPAIVTRCVELFVVPVASAIVSAFLAMSIAISTRHLGESHGWPRNPAQRRQFIAIFPASLLLPKRGRWRILRSKTFVQNSPFALVSESRR